MRVTGLGHASMFIETAYGSILCDPWVHPAFFGSWFPFPDNRGLDWERYGKADFLYVSHRHADHFDPRLLREVVPTTTRVLLPEYPTTDLEDDLRALGYDNFVFTRAGEPFEIDGLRMMITPLRGPGDGPIGDSALSVDDGTAVLLNQNDSHPLDVAKIREFGEVDLYLTQFSGAIWWPMVYDLPVAAKQRFAELKRASQSKRALYYIDQVQPRHVFPMAGPPAFYDPELFDANGWGADDTSIFTDQRQFLAELAVERPGLPGHFFLPGTVVEAARGGSLHGSAGDVRRRGDRAGLRRQVGLLARAAGMRIGEVEAERAGRAPVPDDLGVQLKEWWEPLMKRAPYLSDSIGAQVRFTIGSAADLVLDFPASEVRPYDGESVRYWFTTGADLVATNLARREIDWSNSLFLSMRFSASRIGKFNEYLYTFFKCLSAGPDRLRRELVLRAVRHRRGHRDRRLDRAAALPAPARRPRAVRVDRRHGPHLRPAQLEVRPRERTVLDIARPRDPRPAPGAGRDTRLRGTAGREPGFSRMARCAISGTPPRTLGWTTQPRVDRAQEAGVDDKNWFRDSFRREFDKQTEMVGRFNLAIFGKTGVGKSTLINAIFGEEVARTGIGEPVTRGSHLYLDKVGFLGLIDTQGLEVGKDDRQIIKELDQAIRESRRLPMSEQIHVAWYCVRGMDRRFEDTEADFIRRLSELGLPVLLVMTQVPMREGQIHPEALLLAEQIMAKQLPITGGRPYMTYAKPDEFTGQPAYGLQEVLDATFRVAPEGVHGALTAAQEIDTDRKAKEALKHIGIAAGSAAAAAASPIPFSDATLLVPIQLGMMARIAQLYKIKFDRAALMAIASTTAATQVGRAAFTGLLKLVPGAGTVAGGVIGAGVASTFTYAMGQAWLVVCQRVASGRLTALDGAIDNEAVREVFTEEFKNRLKLRHKETSLPAELRRGLSCSGCTHRSSCSRADATHPAVVATVRYAAR